MGNLFSHYYNMLMDTKKWGKPLWTTMFAVAANFPEEIDEKNKEHRKILHWYRQFFKSIPHILPCSYCRCSSENVISKVVKWDFRSRESLLFSIYLWKSIVNEKLNAQDNRKRKSPPFEQVVARYRKFHVGHKKSNVKKTVQKK